MITSGINMKIIKIEEDGTIWVDCGIVKAIEVKCPITGEKFPSFKFEDKD